MTRLEQWMTDTTMTTPINLLASNLLGALQEAPPLAGETVAPGVAAEAQSGTAPAAVSRPAGDPFGMIWMLIPFLVIMVFVSVMGQRREKKKRNALMASIKKHDEVQTAGGIIGSVVEVKNDTIVLKIDENSNVRMTFAKSAVVQVLTASKDGQGAQS